MASPLTRYPFSTLNGQWIPTDILKVVGSIRKDFIATPGTAVDSFPAGTEIVLVTTTVNAFIKFANAVAVVPVHAGASVIITDEARVLANVPTLLAVPDLHYSIIGETAVGTAWIQVITKWNVLALDVQNQRI